MKTFILFLLCTIFVGCSVVQIENERPLSGYSVQQARYWIANNVAYKADFVDDFQLPSTTFALKTGDCEDFCILLMSVMEEIEPGSTRLVCFALRTDVWHYVVQYKGEYYEAQLAYKKYSREKVETHFLWAYSYPEALAMSH